MGLISPSYPYSKVLDSVHENHPGPHPFIGRVLFSPNLTGNLEDRLGKTLDVARGNTSDGDTAVLGSVDGVLLGEDIHLLGLEASEGEHTDLLYVSRVGWKSGSRLILPGW